MNNAAIPPIGGLVLGCGDRTANVAHSQESGRLLATSGVAQPEGSVGGGLGSTSRSSSASPPRKIAG
jgi:hypothetical protein